MQRYLITNPMDERWGIVISSVGTQRSAPGEAYPPQGHPTRYLFKKETGRVLDEFQLIYIAEGGGEFTSRSAGPVSVHAGDAFLLFPGEWHSYSPHEDSGWTEYWIGFKGEIPSMWLERGFFSPEEPVYHVGCSEEMTGGFSKAIKAAYDQQAGYQQALSGIAIRLLTETIFLSHNKGFIEDSSDQVIMRAKDFIAMKEGITSPEEVAAETGIGYSRFRKLFKEYTGLSPARYIMEIRMAKAKELLTNTSLQVQEIAWRLQFENADYFITAFKRICETTPSSYRSSHS